MDRSANMRAIRSKDMLPELAVRHLVYKLGYRFRLHQKNLPGKPDLVFAGRRKVIFVHGCFWHSHDCKAAHVPKSNVGYWVPKLQRNQARDRENFDALAAGGWDALVIWECETRNIPAVSRRVRAFLGRKGKIQRVERGAL
jgi:DNA mismatch endonuclease (patch repair protein)